MSKEILIIGATGFIGSHTLAELYRRKQAARPFRGDIRKVSAWQKNLRGGEIIMLIAGVRTETPTDFVVNADSIEKLFLAAQDLNQLPQRVILASSQAVYMGNQPPFKESQKPIPTTTYGQSKLQAEEIAQERCQKLSIPLVILRYSTVLGKGIREKSKMSGPLFFWVKAALEGEPLKVFQDGNQTRDYLHIDDVVGANILAIDLPSGIYNVGGGKPIGLIELANWIKEATGSTSEIIIVGGEPSESDPRQMFSDTSKIKHYDWKPAKTAREAVNEFVAMFLLSPNHN